MPTTRELRIWPKIASWRDGAGQTASARGYDVSDAQRARLADVSANRHADRIGSPLPNALQDFTGFGEAGLCHPDHDAPREHAVEDCLDRPDPDRPADPRLFSERHLRAHNDIRAQSSSVHGHVDLSGSHASVAVPTRLNGTSSKCKIPVPRRTCTARPHSACR
jgi:hypothetical protein